ncbi:MAG: DoxX family protein [Gammaproteobacteria bacterium]|nr:DoxX family protein [Gammaproteobacteria bacterium]
MKIAYVILLAVVALLATLSGITKILLMPQDLEFFGRFGFSDPMLITFGVAQLLGGILLVVKTTRFIGATVIASTFLVSLMLLVIDGNVPVSIATGIVTLLLFGIMKQSWPSRR